MGWPAYLEESYSNFYLFEVALGFCAPQNSYINPLTNFIREKDKLAG